MSRPLLAVVKHEEAQNFDLFWEAFSQAAQIKEGVWRIETKYYVAEVDVKIYDKEKAEEQKPEAFLYYLESTATKLLEFCNFIKDCQEEQNPEVSILFLNALPSFQFSREQQKHVDPILQDYLVELVRQDLNGRSKEVKGSGGKIEVGTELLQQDVFGLERVCQAYQCCVWSQMEHKRQQAPTFQAQKMPKELLERKQQLEEGKEEESKREIKVPDMPKPEPSERASDITRPLLSPEEEEKKLNEIMNDDPTKHLSAAAKELIASDEDREAESMIQLMEQMRKIQMQSKTASDEDRKKNAEAMIMKIAAMMDLGDEEDDEEGEPDPTDPEEGWEAA